MNQSASQTTEFQNKKLVECIPLLKNLHGIENILVENSYEDSEFLGLTSHVGSILIEREAVAAGCNVERISQGSIIIRDSSLSGRSMIYFRNTHFFTRLAHFHLLRDKSLTKNVLQQAGVSVAAGRHFSVSGYEDALEYASSIFPQVVVKPSDSSQGRGITVGVCNTEEFKKAWTSAVVHTSGHVRVESMFEGKSEARFLVVDGKCVSVTGRIPPYLIGDGVNTVSQLVTQKNDKRRANPNLSSKLLVLDEARLENLKRQGLSKDSVLPEGELLIIDWKAGLSSGADSIQLIDHIHPSYLDVAAKACNAVPGLTVCGVDIMALDFSLPAQQNNHVVLELNSSSGIGGHHFPVYGPEKNVSKEIVSTHLDILRSMNCTVAGELLAQNLKDEFDSGKDTLLQSIEKKTFQVDDERLVHSQGRNRAVEISVFGDLYDSGILPHIEAYCNANAVHGSARHRIDAGLPDSIHLRARGRADVIEGLIHDLRSGIFSDKIADIKVIKAKKAIDNGFRILSDQKAAVKDAGFEITPGNIGASAPTNSEATRRILIKGEWQVSRARTWCTGLALSLGLTIKCKSKGEDTLICRLQGAEEKIDEFLRHAVVGPEDMRIEMIRVLPLPQDAAQSSAPPQLRKTSQTGPRVLQFAKRMVRRVTAR